MQVTNTNATSSTGIAAGLFGQQTQGTSGLFGLLMNLFGQMGGAAGTPTADGQLVPTGMTGLPQGTQNLPVTNILDAATGIEGMPTDAAGLLAWLQNLAANNPAVSTQLKSLLAPTTDGAPLDLATFQQRLTGLDEASRDEVMSEMAALMQPIFEKPMAPIAALPDGTKVADVAANAPKQPVQPLPEAPLAQAPVTPPTTAPVAPAAAKPQPAAADKPAEPEAQVASAAPKARKPAGIRISGPTTPAEAPVAPEQLAELKALADKALADAASSNSKSASGSEKASTTTQTSSTAGAAMVTAQPSDAKEPTPRSTATGTADPIKPIASAGADSATDAGLKDMAADTNTQQPQQAIGAQDKSAPVPFADHLQQVKLNRTGAHMPVADQISVQLNRALGEGKDRFTVKLSPGELGRIEIRIEMSADGQVMASFKVDQPATLDLLQRDQRGLERMLSDAGLKTDGGSLNFNLRDGGQQNGGQQAQNENSNKGQPGFDLNGDALPEELPVAGVIEATWYVGPDRLNISI